MRSRAMSMLLIASAAACAPAAPSTSPAPDAEVPPVRALLAERDRLSLSPEQVVALDSVSRELDVADGDVGRRLGIIKGGLVPRLGLGKQPDRALALVAGSHRRAAQAVERLLRPDQRERLCELQQARQSKVALRDDKRALARGTHSLASSRERRVETGRTWPWCSSAPSRSSVTAQSES